MPEIEFSVMWHTAKTEEALRVLLDEFTQQSGIQVKLNLVRWETAHADLNRVALYHRGPDVSEIASTWVTDLISMNALHPFTNLELLPIGRPEEFLSEAWKTGHRLDENTQWAIPWLTETYVIHYRRDLLRQAGIDEASAFESHAQFAATVQQLGAAGIPVPFEPLLEMDHFGNLHSLASWVWTAGGDFCSPDGKQALFTRPEALAAIRAYFELFRLLKPAVRQKIREGSRGLFQSGEAAIRFGTLVFAENRAHVAPVVKENWACAPLPGQHFIGGSNLVIWKHTRNERAAAELIRFLTSAAVQPRCALPMAAFPPRLAALASPEISQDPMLRIMADSIRSGRSYRQVPLWGLVEDRLVATLLQIGKAAISEEDLDLDALIRQYMEPLARKLNTTLAQ